MAAPIDEVPEGVRGASSPLAVACACGLEVGYWTWTRGAL